MPIKFAICDDEPVQIKCLEKLVYDWSKLSEKDIQIETFNSAESFYFKWSEDKSFDILLLDIQMNGQNGIELARSIRGEDDSIAIIFVTGLDEYIDEGYEVSAVHYLIKPIKQDKFFEALDRAIKKIKVQEKAIIISYNNENIKIKQSDICYIEAFAHYISIVTKTDTYDIKRSISDFEKELEHNTFYRCHRSFIVGIKYIEKITKKDILLEDGKIIPVSRLKYSDLNKCFIHYHCGGRDQ
jgi:DNA-binding LytR/AlgR family response regulator